MKWGSDTYTLLRSTVRQAAVISNQGIKALCPRSQLQQQKTGLGPDQNSNMPELTSKLCVHRHKKKKRVPQQFGWFYHSKGFYSTEHLFQKYYRRNSPSLLGLLGCHLDQADQVSPAVKYYNESKRIPNHQFFFLNRRIGFSLKPFLKHLPPSVLLIISLSSL